MMDRQLIFGRRMLLLGLCIGGYPCPAAPQITLTPLSNSQCSLEQIKVSLQMSSDGAEDILDIDFGNTAFQTNLATNISEIVQRCNFSIRIASGQDRWLIRSGSFLYALNATADAQGYFSVRLQSPNQVTRSLVQAIKQADGELSEVELPLDQSLKANCDNSSDNFTFRSKIFADIEESSPSKDLQMIFKKARFKLARVTCPYRKAADEPS